MNEKFMGNFRYDMHSRRIKVVAALDSEDNSGRYDNDLSLALIDQKVLTPATFSYTHFYLEPEDKEFHECENTVHVWFDKDSFHQYGEKISKPCIYFEASFGTSLENIYRVTQKAQELLSQALSDAHRLQQIQKAIDQVNNQNKE